jgi:hypothetical protein
VKNSKSAEATPRFCYSGLASDFGSTGANSFFRCIVFLVPLLRLSLVSDKHFLGHLFTHSLQVMHLKAFSSQVEFVLSTVIASAGQTLWHMVQKVQSSILLNSLPLVLSKGSLTTSGYILVAGFLMKFLVIIENILAIFSAPLSNILAYIYVIVYIC